MNAEDVTRIIEEEIAGEWDLSNLHGVDLKRCLVPPMLRAFDGASSGDHWLVLEEDPIGRRSYKIVFHEERMTFGLAISGVDGAADFVVGYYGTFLETLAAM